MLTSEISTLDDDHGFKGNPGFGPGQEGEPAELACRLVERAGLPQQRQAELVKKQATEVRTGVDPLGETLPVDEHGEAVTSGVDPAIQRCAQDVRPPGSGLGPALGRLEGPPQPVLVVVMGAGQAGEFGHLGVDAGLLHDQRVAGGQGLTWA